MWWKCKIEQKLAWFFRGTSDFRICFLCGVANGGHGFASENFQNYRVVSSILAIAGVQQSSIACGRLQL